MHHEITPALSAPVAAPVAALTYSLAEVTAALGYRTEATFRRARPKLEKAGFPRRIPGMLARWSRPAVDAWVAQAGTEG